MERIDGKEELESALDYWRKAGDKIMNENKPPLFASHVRATFERCVATTGTRANDYADSWRDVRYETFVAVTKKLGYNILPEHVQAIVASAIVDIKHNRLTGGWKDDTLIDGINYQAFLAEEMRRLSCRPTPVVCVVCKQHIYEGRSAPCGNGGFICNNCHATLETALQARNVRP